MRQKKRPPSLEALYSGALGEIRTPYPLVRSQVHRSANLRYDSESCHVTNLSRLVQQGFPNPLFFLDRHLINEINFRAISVDSSASKDGASS